jgi:AcrR family transcriptional regulator
MSDNTKDPGKKGPAPRRDDRRRAVLGKGAAGPGGRSDGVGETRRAIPDRQHGKRPRSKVTQRLPRAERQALVLAKAADYFAEHGLDAQTRAIAQVCGVSQRLLYSLFPSKAALIEEVYNREIAGIFKAIWFVGLKDRSVPLEARLIAFYRDYYETLLTRRWLRLFLYSSLAGLQMAPTYSNAVVAHALEIVVTEAAHDTGRAVPPTTDELTEVGWILHGAVSHLAIRRRIYVNDNAMPAEDVIAMTVRAFLASIPTLLPPLPSA